MIVALNCVCLIVCTYACVVYTAVKHIEPIKGEEEQKEIKTETLLCIFIVIYIDYLLDVTCRLVHYQYWKFVQTKTRLLFTIVIYIVWKNDNNQNACAKIVA